ncbi:hypothetical protein ACLKA6_012855 [Drosophila palustris]
MQILALATIHYIILATAYTTHITPAATSGHPSHQHTGFDAIANTSTTNLGAVSRNRHPPIGRRRIHTHAQLYKSRSTVSDVSDISDVSHPKDVAENEDIEEIIVITDNALPEPPLADLVPEQVIPTTSTEQSEASGDELVFSVNIGKSNVMEVIEMAVGQVGEGAFTNKVITDHLLSFICSSFSVVSTLKNHFNKKGLQVIGPKQNTRKIIINGLHPNVPVEWIHKELVKLQIAPIRIANIKNKHDLPSSKFKVEVSHQGESNFLNIKTLGTFKVTVEEIKPQTIYQCFRCQKFDHHITKCKAKVPVCFKCTGPHQGKDCQKSKAIDATCSNCGGNHVASNPYCQAYMNAVRKQKQSSSTFTTFQKAMRAVNWDTAAAFDSAGPYILRHSDAAQATSTPRRPPPDLMRI